MVPVVVVLRVFDDVWNKEFGGMKMINNQGHYVLETLFLSNGQKPFQFGSNENNYHSIAFTVSLCLPIKQYEQFVLSKSNCHQAHLALDTNATQPKCFD